MINSRSHTVVIRALHCCDHFIYSKRLVRHTVDRLNFSTFMSNVFLLPCYRYIKMYIFDNKEEVIVK